MVMVIQHPKPGICKALEGFCFVLLIDLHFLKLFWPLWAKGYGLFCCDAL